MTLETQSFPRLVIAAPQGRSGKTTLTLGLCAAFRQRGLSVQPFKKGPDYIDPSWLSKAAGTPCRSLDPFFDDRPESLRLAFTFGARRADLSLVEGNHGLFDSFDEAGLGSTAAMARTLQSPILLVVNAVRIGRSIAAIVHGCQTFEADTRIAGVVLNSVAHSRHAERMRQAIEIHCGIPVLGVIPRDEKLTIPDRHLGLVPCEEGDELQSALFACQQAIENNVDLDAVLSVSRTSPSLSVPIEPPAPHPRSSSHQPHIGVLRDRAFTFYYPENLEALESAGAELVFFDAIRDPDLPDLDALYIGGGFPEMFLDDLSANVSMRMSVLQAVESGLPVYAECGGMMYLSRRIRWGQRSAEMVGAIPCEIEMTDSPQGHGYVVALVDGANPFFALGTTLRGHEFHNSRVAVALDAADAQPALRTAYSLGRGNGLGDGRDGIVVRNVLASYMHLHVSGSDGWAEGLVNRARLFQASHQIAISER